MLLAQNNGLGFLGTISNLFSLFEDMYSMYLIIYFKDNQYNYGN